MPLVAVSSAECVDALLLAEFAVHLRTDETTLLVRGGRAVSVRTAAMLGPDELLGLLREAGLAYSDFLDLLSDAPTAPDLRWPLRAASSAPPR